MHLSWFQPLSFQLGRVLISAHVCAGSPRGHALRTFHHVPPQPLLASQLLRLQLAVALGVGRVGTKIQPARGAVFQRLHALLWESSKAEPQPVLRWVSVNPAGGSRLGSICSPASCVSMLSGGRFLLLLSQQEARNPKDNGPAVYIYFCHTFVRVSYFSLTFFFKTISMRFMTKTGITSMWCTVHEQLTLWFLLELWHGYHDV